MKEPAMELTDVTIDRHLDELAAIEPTGFPFISLYLNAQAFATANGATERVSISSAI